VSHTKFVQQLLGLTLMMKLAPGSIKLEQSTWSAQLNPST